MIFKYNVYNIILYIKMQDLCDKCHNLTSITLQQTNTTVKPVNESAIFLCKSCLFSKVIENKTRIYTKFNQPEIKKDVNKLVNCVRSSIYPRTRNFICDNKTCPSIVDNVPTEAMFFSTSQTSYNITYICCICGTLKEN